MVFKPVFNALFLFFGRCPIRGLSEHMSMFREGFCIITGEDVAPRVRDGVAAMHKVFDWASAKTHV